MAKRIKINEEFNEKEGLIKSLKTALKSDNFVMSLIDLLLGDEDKCGDVAHELRIASQENTLNEVVSVHRFFKNKTLNENAFEVKVSLKGKNLIEKLRTLRKESVSFWRKVLVRTLKKPGQLLALFYIIKAIVTLGYPVDDVIAMPVTIKFLKSLLDTAIEVYEEEHGEEQSSEINESFDPDAPKVSLFVGRFQPFTLAHLKCVKKLKEAYGAPVLICMIPVSPEKADNEHPFYGNLQEEMYKRLQEGLKQEYPELVADVVSVPNSFIDNTIAAAKELGYQPIAWGCGTDRYEVKKNVTVGSTCNDCGFKRKRAMEKCPKCGSTNITNDTEERIEGYKPMHDKFIAKQGGLDPEEQSIDPENFQLLHIQRDTAGEGDDYVSKISGTKVREAIRNNDVETFKRMVPQCLYPLFFKFQKALRELEEPEQEIGAQQEPAYQSAAINEMIDEITKRIMKQLLK